MRYTLSYHFYKLRAANYIREYRNVEKFIAFCKECNRYDNCWVCPPYEQDALAGSENCEFVYLIGTQIVPLQEEKQHTFSGQEKQKISWQLLKEVRAKIDPCLRKLEIEYPASRVFYAGTCHLCPENECRKIRRLPCCHPDLIRPSLEASGFDLGRTAAELLHLPLKWCKAGEWPDYWMLISGIFTCSEINLCPEIFE